MSQHTRAVASIDFEKYRLRRFVERLIDMGEVAIHDEPVPLTGLGAIIEGTDKAVLFRKAGPEQVELVAKTAGNRKRLAAAFDTTADKLYDEYFRRLANPQPVVEVPSDEAPVHEVKITGKDVDLTRLPFHPQHEYDGSCYLSSASTTRSIPETGRTNVGCRRLSLRNRYETGTNVTAPSDLKRIYQACVARGERLPITFTIGGASARLRSPRRRASPATSWRWWRPCAASRRRWSRASPTTSWFPPTPRSMLEGYLDERGYFEPEGPYGEYMGYYGAIHLDPVFHCTAITMRRDVMHQTLLHGSACVLDQTDSDQHHGAAHRGRGDDDPATRPCASRSPSARGRLSGGSNTLRVSIRQHAIGEARSAIAALFGGIMRLKHVCVFDEDIDIRDDRQVEWAIGTRFQADQDLVVLTGHAGHADGPVAARGGRPAPRPASTARGRSAAPTQIPLTRSAAKVFAGPARFQTVEQALAGGPMFFSDIVEAVGSDDGREVACALDALRQSGQARPRPRRPLSPRPLQARRHRHRRRALPRSQRRDVRFSSSSS